MTTIGDFHHSYGKSPKKGRVSWAGCRQCGIFCLSLNGPTLTARRVQITVCTRAMSSFSQTRLFLLIGQVHSVTFCGSQRQACVVGYQSQKRHALLLGGDEIMSQIKCSLHNGDFKTYTHQGQRRCQWPEPTPGFGRPRFASYVRGRRKAGVGSGSTGKFQRALFVFLCWPVYYPHTNARRVDQTGVGANAQHLGVKGGPLPLNENGTFGSVSSLIHSVFSDLHLHCMNSWRTSYKVKIFPSEKKLIESSSWPGEEAKILPLRNLGRLLSVVFLVELQQHVRHKLVPVHGAFLPHVNFVEEHCALKDKSLKYQNEFTALNQNTFKTWWCSRNGRLPGTVEMQKSGEGEGFQRCCLAILTLYNEPWGAASHSP